MFMPIQVIGARQPKPSFSSEFGKAIGGGFSQGVANQLAEQSNRRLSDEEQKRRIELQKLSGEQHTASQKFASELRTKEREDERKFEIEQAKAQAKARELPKFGQSGSEVRNPAEGLELGEPTGKRTAPKSASKNKETFPTE